MQNVYRLDKPLEGTAFFVNGPGEERFALVRDITLQELANLAQKAQLAAYNAWLQMQQEKGRTTAFNDKVPKEHLALLPPASQAAISAAVKAGDQQSLVTHLEDLKLHDYDVFVSLPKLGEYRTPLIVEAIFRLAKTGRTPIEVLDALLAAHCVNAPGNLVPELEDMVQNTTFYAKKYFERHVVAFAAYLTSQCILLHPTKFRQDNVATAFEPSRYPALGGEQAHLLSWFAEALKQVNGLTGDQHRFTCATCWNMLRASSVLAAGHFTPNLLGALLDAFAPAADARGAGVSHVRGALRHIIQAYPVLLEARAPQLMRKFKAADLVARIAAPRERERQVEDFNWLTVKRPDLAAWGDLARRWLARGKVRVSTTAVYGVNHFLDFLAQLDEPVTSPRDFGRRHVVNEMDHEDPETLWGFVHTLTNKLKEDEKVGQATRNRVLASAQELLEFFSDQEVLAGREPYFVPLNRKDRVGWGKVMGKSVRQALPVRLLNRMKTVMLSPDAGGQPTFVWAKQEATDWVNVINRATGQVETVYYPGRAILLYMLLATPLRSFQARWLDSGERDAEVYSASASKMVRNEAAWAVKGKADGLLRSMPVDFGEGEFLGLWINTNKTGFYEPGKVKGYGIPWCDQTVQGLVELLLDWHSRYYGVGASSEPPLVTLYQGERRGLTDRVFKLMPKFVPLFRDPGSDNRRDHDLPISSYRLRCLFGQLLAEVEMQFQAEGERLSLVEWLKGKDTAEPGKMVLAAHVSPKVDLHTLRVTGITALIDAGVPAHVVSEFVAGHASVVMTLYYHHHGPTKIREMLSRAYESIGSESFDLDGLTALYDSRPEEAAKFFLTQEGAAPNNTALMFLKSNIGVATVSHAGICPGANCDEGGQCDAKGRPTPVPGGPGSCGQCRYWITGPAFLVGQVMEANTLMYKVRDKAEEIKRIRDAAKQARLVGEATGKLNLLAGRAERAEREIAALLAEWGARYRYIVISNRLLDEWQASKGSMGQGNALVAAGSVSELRFAAKSAANLELLHHLGVQAELFPEMGATQGAIAELELTIAQILAHNDMDGLLLKLSSQERLAACNLFSDTILRLTGGDEQTLNNITNGSLKLSAFTGWHREAQALASQLKLQRQPMALTFEGEPA